MVRFWGGAPFRTCSGGAGAAPPETKQLNTEQLKLIGVLANSRGDPRIAVQHRAPVMISCAAMRTRPVVAIDGPAGAGKSTVARQLATHLGFTLVDTGALYRAVALSAQRAGISSNDEAGMEAVLPRGLVASRGLSLVPDPELGVRVMLSGEDVSDAIRAADMGMGASRVSAIGGVRDALFQLQRLAGEDGGVVLEGRDIGTVVFPDAEVKFFLTASAEVRARRRHAELVARGEEVGYEKTLEDVRSRDRNDTMRSIAPLRQADDAILIDSSARSIDEVVHDMAQNVVTRAP